MDFWIIAGSAAFYMAALTVPAPLMPEMPVQDALIQLAPAVTAILFAITCLFAARYYGRPREGEPSAVSETDQ
jgi:hypothetical protein